MKKPTKPRPHKRYRSQLDAISALEEELEVLLKTKNASDAAVLSRLVKFKDEWDKKSQGPLEYALAVRALIDKKTFKPDGSFVYRALIGLMLDPGSKRTSDLAKALSELDEDTADSVVGKLKSTAGGAYGLARSLAKPRAKKPKKVPKAKGPRVSAAAAPKKAASGRTSKGVKPGKAR